MIDDDLVLNGRDSAPNAEPALGGRGDQGGEGGSGDALNLSVDLDGKVGMRGGGGGGGSVGYILFVDLGQGPGDVSDGAIISPMATQILVAIGSRALLAERSRGPRDKRLVFR